LISIRPKKIANLLEVIQEHIKAGRYRDTSHAIQRKKERKIILPEILHVLRTGRHEKSKDYYEERFHSWNYSICGATIDKEDLRVIVSFEEKDLLVITAFYLEKKGQ